ncbi:hypothetical protein [Streptomyces sp. RPT161]|uniref:hypothetical protein n=1 Tax=Streptomyces sp. RPT161 TaxID=3015993 RepID=UPI0022B920E9|nr:hypothetical protein [Streptomyces sp. RPT161]
MGNGRDPAPDEGTSGQRQSLTVGLLVAPGLVKDVVSDVIDTLREKLNERYPDYDWNVVVQPDAQIAAGAGVDVDLVGVTRRRALEEGWQLALCLTDLPLNVGRRPVTAHVSVARETGVVSVPALGAVDLPNRVVMAVLRVVDRLLTGSRKGERGRERRGSRRRSELLARLRALRELSSPVGRPYRTDRETVRFVISAGRGVPRLLLGMVRANRPWHLIVGLSRALVAALGTAAFGLTSPGIWQIANGMGPPRLLLTTLLSVVGIWGTIIVAHGLWERGPSPRAHRRVVLMNAVTALTVALGVVTLYLALLVIITLFGLVLISPEVLRRQLQHTIGIVNYLDIAWAVSSLATIGGTLGATLESDSAVREAAYGYRAADTGHGEADED